MTGIISFHAHGYWFIRLGGVAFRKILIDGLTYGDSYIPPKVSLFRGGGGGGECLIECMYLQVLHIE